MDSSSLKVEAKQCGFRQYVEYVTDPNNIWNHEKYLQGRSVSADCFNDLDSKFNYQYCLGTSFLIGYIGKARFKIFQTPQGFQVYHCGLSEKFSDKINMSFMLYRPVELLKYVEEVARELYI